MSCLEFAEFCPAERVGEDVRRRGQVGLQGGDKSTSASSDPATSSPSTTSVTLPTGGRCDRGPLRCRLGDECEVGAADDGAGHRWDSWLAVPSCEYCSRAGAPTG